MTKGGGAMTGFGGGPAASGGAGFRAGVAAAAVLCGSVRVARLIRARGFCTGAVAVAVAGAAGVDLSESRA